MVTLTHAIPALPERDATTAVTYYRDATVDQDGNLLTFFRWESS